MPHRQHLVRLRRRAAETMENPAQLTGVFPQDGQRVFPRVALVDDNVETRLGREVELLAKHGGLRRLVCALLALAFREMVVIQSGLADGRDPGLGHEFPQRPPPCPPGPRRRSWDAPPPRRKPSDTARRVPLPDGCFPPTCRW